MYRSPEGRHRHKCAATTCNAIWEHDNGMGVRVAHTCPVCGSMQWKIYEGVEPPEFHDPGRNPQAAAEQRAKLTEVLHKLEERNRIQANDDAA